MKYPQLVSPRAVNAISDWLVSRLEQLGVESPQIYTRLLLSLLQSSVQVNDPIEFSNLEAFFANRKGGHKRFYLPSDTETLKKLNAVQCLREIVSNEQENFTIELLVDELCEKLKDIEKQTQHLSDRERFLIQTHLNTDTLLHDNSQLQNQQLANEGGSSKTYHQHHTRNNAHQHHHQNQQQQQQQQQLVVQIDKISRRVAVANSELKRHNNYINHVGATTSQLINDDVDNDPKKRYFRAFPALSKEMEDSFRIWRRNAKSLTWPIVGRAIVVDNCHNNNNKSLTSCSSSSSGSIISSSNFGANNSVSTDKSVHHPQHLLEHKVSAGTVLNNLKSDCSGEISLSDDQRQQQHQGVAAASVKKKPKRRRNQGLCKGKSIQNVRKHSVGATSNSVGVNKYHHHTYNRNTSPAWDTDFKGCWEMGPDLIKEFLSHQNDNRRNRSNSDSMDHDEHNECQIVNEMTVNDDKSKTKSYIDLSFCCDYDDEVEILNKTQPYQQYTNNVADYVDEDYDDNTLASVTDLTIDSINQKRLYQREGRSQKSLAYNMLTNNLNETSDSVDPLEFKHLKAKFNSSVKALWKDVESTPVTTPTSHNSLKAENPSHGVSISSAFYATTSLNALAPFKKDLWNFWSNYNQQQPHFDQIPNKLSTTAPTSSMFTTTRLDDSSASSGAGADMANSSDYFSMPSNLDDFDKSVGSVRRTNESGASLGAHTPSFNVFLQNSIWSTPRDCTDDIGTSATASNTDENFLFKVWHSSKKLSQLDVGNGFNDEKMPTLLADNDVGSISVNNNNDFRTIDSFSVTINNPNVDANLQFPPYHNLKWSEGINGGPRSPGNNLTLLHEMDSLTHNNITSLRSNNNYSSYSSAANLSGATWEAPSNGQSAQPDLKSWCASNPMSLTEMYGSDVCDSIVNPAEEEIDVAPVVTLPNHCPTTSGFVAYSRIKQCGIVQPQTKPVNTAVRLEKDFYKGGDEENLLNSERTHFHPIEQFVDGHTFDISNALDTIEFDRTASGLLRYDSLDYLEYTRNDIYMADEEVATNSTKLLKFSRRPNDDKKEKEFVIKFRIKRSEEIACQTEENDFQLASFKIAKVPLTNSPPSAITNMFNNTFSLSRPSNNEAIMAAVTKAVAAAAKAAAEKHLNPGNFSWLSTENTENINTTTATVVSANTMENNPIWISEKNICDEVDFCNVNSNNRGQQQHELTQNWSMHEVEKQCYQRRCFPKQQLQLQQQQQQQEIKNSFLSSVDIEKSEENSLDNTSLHTLWGMCAVCNSCEYDKSLPANRLLRDELQLEADEIMSDLRYMQDLYIGESDIPNETSGVDNELGNGNKIYGNINKEIGMNAMKNPWNVDAKENAGLEQDPVQISMLQKVNQLIENLLKPDCTAKLAERETIDSDKIIKETELENTWNHLQNNRQIDAKHFWQFGKEDGNNIWQHKPSVELCEKDVKKEKAESFFKPMKLLKQVGGSLSEDTQYREILNWEHDNLAKIWQKTIPPSIQIEEEFLLLKRKQNEMTNEIHNKNLLFQQQEEKEEAFVVNQTQVEEKNLKNLQRSNVLTPPSTVSSSNSYKRVQQFLNNSAVKLKIAANRKRRHSASQNFYQQEHFHYNNNNNNNANISNLNAYKQKFNETIRASNEHQHKEVSTTSYNNMNVDEQPTKQTIITCKYWTTTTNGTQSSMDSATAAMMLLAAAASTNTNNTNDISSAKSCDQEDVMLEENMCGNTFSCIIDKNSSILKHVTMMTRPLTR